MYRYKKHFRSFLLASLALLFLVLPLGVQAASSKDDKSKKEPADLSSEVTNSYNADPAVQLGMAVQTKDGDPSTVVPLKEDQSDKILGVVIPQKTATIVLAPESVTAQQVLVTNKGRFGLIVSNQNGPVKVGDYLMISAIAGVGMRADSSADKQVIGKAITEFNGTSNVIGSIELKDALGRKTTVSLGRVTVDVAIGHNPLFAKKADYVPDFLAKIAQTITDKPVSAARIYLSLVVLLIIGYLTSSITYSGIRNGMLSIGRNPLSKRHVMKGLIQTILAGIIIFVTGIFGVYLLLKL